MPLIDLTGQTITRVMNMFPSYIQFGPDAKLQLRADGTCHGDLAAVLEAIAGLPAGPDLPVMWLIAKAVREQLERDSKPNCYGEDGIFVDLDPATDFEDTVD